ncbi:hypothetical protein AEA09_09245 [Lysinibacillus contaminans]|uniref:Permease n=1 Tax=Lysinibacillus contaminans TaxID=1293441 RepID=A0ABR5K1R4_9BACI|nr:hypothetical protein [Lysinibacillus contaminans]KOS68708.1 hypothetical protein AEA09_09245 [Lysinibacillus contaminans]
MNELYTKYAKYVSLICLIIGLIYAGIPDVVKSVFIYEYGVFFGIAYLLFILRDFFNPSKKIVAALTIANIISAFILFITAVYFKDVFSTIFSATMCIGISFAFYLESKKDHKNKQKA